MYVLNTCDTIMVNYLKNLIVKLLLLPVLALIGLLFLLVFLLAPQFKLFKDKNRPWSFNNRGKHGYEEESKNY
jgi:hypothetical protein